MERTHAQSNKGKTLLWRRLRQIFSLTAENATPINKRMALLSFIAMVASAYPMTYTQPFVPDMILWFGYREEEKGYFVGIISSAFHIGRFIGSYFWGWLSDRKSVRFVILLNCLLMAAWDTGFGLSVNVWMAASMRCLCGMSSGIVVVLKAQLRELSDSTNQSLYLSIITLGWSVGMTVGPLISGYLSNPVKKNMLSAGNMFLTRHPYFLSALSSVIYLLFTFVVIALKWDKWKRSAKVKLEIEPQNTKHEDHTLFNGHNDINLQKTSQLVSDNTPTSRDDTTGESHVETCLLDSKVPERKKLETTPEQQNITVQNETDNSVPLIKCSSVFDVEKTQTSHKSRTISRSDKRHIRCKKGRWYRNMGEWNICKLLRNSNFFTSTLIYSLMGISYIGFDVVFATWASTDVQLNGLGFQPEEIGQFVSMAALPIIFLQIYIYPKLEIRFGAKKVFHWFCCTGILVLSTMPASRILLDIPPALWTCLLTLHALNAFSESVTFCSMALFINNSVPTSLAGSANGVATSMAAFVRILSPSVCGSIFAWSITSGGVIGFPFDVNCVFLLLAGVYWLCNLLCVLLPDTING